MCSFDSLNLLQKVLSLEDGKTYERSALTRRNLSRAAHERQAAAWVEAQSEATEALVNDGSLSLVREFKLHFFCISKRKSHASTVKRRLFFNFEIALIFSFICCTMNYPSPHLKALTNLLCV
jgi:hypothetical protein